MHRITTKTPSAVNALQPHANSLSVTTSAFAQEGLAEPRAVLMQSRNGPPEGWPLACPKQNQLRGTDAAGGPLSMVFLGFKVPT